MYLDYSKLAFDKNGTPETPTLVLKTMHEETIGVIPGVYNLKLSVKFAEPSEMTFDVPAILDGEKNWIYDELVGYKVIYTEHYGIYVVMNPTTSADGISDVKHVQCYSLEKVLDTKKFFLEDGDDGSTFKFFNQTNHNDPDTIIGRVLEVADGWHMGYVAPSVAQRYRTFDGYTAVRRDAKLLCDRSRLLQLWLGWNDNDARLFVCHARSSFPMICPFLSCSRTV